MATTASQPRGRQRNALRNPVTWVIVLGIALAGGAYLLYRRRNTAAAANSSTAATPNNEDLAGQIATLQTELADLQSTGAQDEAAESGAPAGGGGGGGGGGGKLTAPSGFSITPHNGFADFGWSTVPGAKAYELQVAGAGGRGTGTSHYDHAGAGNHAEHVSLANGSYKARVRAGTSVTSLSGPWTPYKGFQVTGAHGIPRPRPNPRPGSNGSEPED